MGLLGLGIYGVPIAMAGLAYLLFFGTLLLPKGSLLMLAHLESDDLDNILLGARVKPWSPVAG